MSLPEAQIKILSKVAGLHVRGIILHCSFLLLLVMAQILNLAIKM